MRRIIKATNKITANLRLLKRQKSVGRFLGKITPKPEPVECCTMTIITERFHAARREKNTINLFINGSALRLADRIVAASRSYSNRGETGASGSGALGALGGLAAGGLLGGILGDDN